MEGHGVVEGPGSARVELILCIYGIYVLRSDWGEDRGVCCNRQDNMALNTA